MLLHWTPARAARHIRMVSIVLALLAGWLTGVPSWAGIVHGIAIQPNRIVVRFDPRLGQAAEALLPRPDQVAADVVGGRNRNGATGQVAADGARLIFDLTQPALVVRGGLTARAPSLAIELRTVAGGHFTGSTTSHGHTVSMPVPPRPAPFSLPRIYGSDDDRPLVVIDPGHGGHDPGSISAAGIKEKDLALDIAKAIRDGLAASDRVRVAMTREDDRYLLHHDRFETARKLGAALFISIHCDAAHTPDATGATIYTLSDVASDKEAARLAARENRSDILGGVDLAEENRAVSSILIDLAQRETMGASARFARLLGREAKGLIPVRANAHRMASLLVLKAPDVPSVLFETGYISNEQDVALLSSPEGRRRIAQSVRNAALIHLATQTASR